jgi:hypothetical protein
VNVKFRVNLAVLNLQFRVNTTIFNLQFRVRVVMLSVGQNIELAHEYVKCILLMRGFFN